MLVIKTDVTHTVTHQTTHILPPAGTQNALGESHKKASTQQAARSITLLARCRRAHGARLGRWRSQKHRQWPSAGVSGGGRDLTLRADDPTSRGTTQPPTNPTQHQTTPLKARFSCWAQGVGTFSVASPWRRELSSALSRCVLGPGGSEEAVWGFSRSPAGVAGALSSTHAALAPDIGHESSATVRSAKRSTRPPASKRGAPPANGARWRVGVVRACGARAPERPLVYARVVGAMSGRASVDEALTAEEEKAIVA